MDRLLPVKRDNSRLGSSSYTWPENVKYSLLALAKGPRASQVERGELLYDCIVDMQRESGFTSPNHMARDAADGMSLFFDDLLSRSDARKFFHQVLPGIAALALALPVLLETQTQELTQLFARFRNAGFEAENVAPHELRPDMVLQLLSKHQRGTVVLSQRLVASLLACSFLCLYPSAERRRENLPYVNMDGLFAGIYERGESIEHKMLCLIRYFERVCQEMPDGAVSFERKVVSAQSLRDGNAFWSESGTSLCPLTVVVDGNIEDLGQECLQVDFANKMLGGGALADGCVQEEIRFMINPELAAGMVFLPAMSGNESIEIVGAERYSNYRGYASTFRFTGGFHDSSPRDCWGRRRTHIIAMDALSQPGDDQFRLPYRMRELSKAYCGFLDTGNNVNGDDAFTNLKSTSVVQESTEFARSGDSQSKGFSLEFESAQLVESERDGGHEAGDEAPGTSGQVPGMGLGIATGNWGCGVFGGNLPLKSMLQWLAASQAGRPFVLYFSFQNPDARRLQEVADWILQEGWLVGELWSLISEYAQNKHFRVNLFDWILPLPATDLAIVRPPHPSKMPSVAPSFLHSRGGAPSNSQVLTSVGSRSGIFD